MTAKVTCYTGGSRVLALSTDHASSSYGIPVLIMADGRALGPCDVAWEQVVNGKVVARLLAHELVLRNPQAPADEADATIEAFGGPAFDVAEYERCETLLAKWREACD